MMNEKLGTFYVHLTAVDLNNLYNLFYIIPVTALGLALSVALSFEALAQVLSLALTDGPRPLYL
jgi:hypothetical protein